LNIFIDLACLSVFLFALFSKRSFVGSAELLLNYYYFSKHYWRIRLCLWSCKDIQKQ